MTRDEARRAIHAALAGVNGNVERATEAVLEALEPMFVEGRGGDVTKEQRDILVEHGPYELSARGAILDCNGVALADCRCGNPSAEEVAWDRAVVAALNEVCATSS